MLAVIRNILGNLGKESPRPLGRWHNVGDRFRRDRMDRKECQKHLRAIYKKYNIDPYSLSQTMIEKGQ